jgi:hypothetical protein
MGWFKGIATVWRPAAARYAAIAAVFTIFAARAQTNEPSPPPSHEHGVANLIVAVQGQRLAFTFSSPAVNLTGFERAPQSDTEQRTASYAKGQLQQAPRLFITSPGANCRLFASKVDEPAWDGDAEHHDYRARYVFQCGQPQRLQSIDVQLANQLAPGTKLQTQVLVGNTKQSVELAAGRTTVRIQQ